MALRFEQFYRIKTRTNLGDVKIWNERFSDVDRRLNAAETALESVDAIGQRIEGVALDRINNLVTPLVLETIERVRQIPALFSADSASTVDLAGPRVVFTVEADQRATFAHQGFISATPVAEPESGLLGRVESFDRQSGALVVVPVQAWGSGSFDAWTLAAINPPGAHAGRTDNPHGTTAAQVGAYTKAEVDTALDAVATAADDQLDAAASSLGTQISGVASGLSSHAGRTDNPHATTAAQVGAYAKAEADGLFAKARNRIINPGLQWSQENGSAALTWSSGGAAFYAADNLAAQRSGGGSVTVQQLSLSTPGGSNSRVRVTVGTAASAAAGDYAALLVYMEGVDNADLRWGTASASPAVLRLGVRSSVAGLYTIAVRNGDFNRSWLGSFTIQPGEVGQDVLKSFIIPGDVTGTWPTNTGRGISINISLVAGSNLIGAAGWQAGNFAGLAGQVNLLGTTGATFDVFDLGFYKGNLLPAFELPAPSDDLARCRRYWRRTRSLLYRASPASNYNGGVISVSAGGLMRTTPTISVASTIGAVTPTSSATRTPVPGDVFTTSFSNDSGSYQLWFAAPGSVGDYIDCEVIMNARL